LEVHEFPSIARDSADVLKDGMVFTIEPGIYIPGKMGVRFEDMVLLKNGKARILTR
jgi:Xaa-Pro aminopeptidase